MHYPKFLERGLTIGITAPSAGVGDDIESFEKSLTNLKKEGYNLQETKSVREKGIVSSSAKQRAKELDELVLDPNISMISFATGGDFLLEMLPFINWNHIKENPKWMMGYSDPTSILYTTTTFLDIATIYGPNAGGFDQQKLHNSLKNTLEILKGNILEQHSFSKYQKEKNKEQDGYHLTEKVIWESINQEQVDITGRIIGGCLDCLKDIIGTPCDHTKEFIEKYKKDGIIFYFDVFSKSAEEFYLTLEQMRQVGWFQYCKGIIVGRVCFPMCFNEDFSYQKALKKFSKDLPIIFNADIGHVPPKMTIINGSIAHITCKDGKGTLKQVLKP